MRLDIFIYLITIARLGSISAAAEHLHISQPTISQSLYALEEELGAKLFNRSKQGTLPTEIGKVIIDKAQIIVKTYEEIKELTSNPENLIDHLTIATIPTLGTSALPKVIAKFKDQYPLVTMNIIEGGTHEVEQMVNTGIANLGLVSSRNTDSFVTNKDLHFESLASGKLMISVGRNSLLAKKNAIEFKQIIDYPIVIFNNQYRLYHYILNILKKYGEPKVLFESENTEIVRSIISSGDGIGFCNNLSIKNDPYFVSKQLVPVPISDEYAEFSFGWIRSSSSHFSIAGQKLIRILQEEIKKISL